MHIPVNRMTDKSSGGIAIAREVITSDWIYHQLQDSHRDEYHIFLLQEEGTSELRVDFQAYHLPPKSIMCIHPNQVHQLGPFTPGKVTFLIIDNEGLFPAQLNSLEDITSLKPLTLDHDSFHLIQDAVTICVKTYEDAEKKLHRTLVKESCNFLVSLFISQYLTIQPPLDQLSRFDLVTKAFKSILEHDFKTLKRPADYAEKLHISKTYLYECVKNTTGFSISYHIEQRVVLEAKRLLYYSDRSVKEIAADLGFGDYPYFTRFFAKVTGMTALAFRRKNRN